MKARSESLKQLLINNIQITTTVVVINVMVLILFILNKQVLHGIGYFVFFFLAIALIHLTTNKVEDVEYTIHNPKKEFGVTLLFMAIGTMLLFINFYLKGLDLKLGFLIKLPLVLGMLIFTFPIGVIIYLWRRGYRLPQLGFRFKPAHILITGVLVWGLTGLFAYIFYPEGILWSRAYEEFGGVGGMILQGVIGAALAEELWRYFVQTRLYVILKSPLLPILIASVLWALMHFPVTYSKNNDVLSTLSYCLQIIPLGIIWGYLTYRTKSIIPSVLVHGLNLWGFQNS